MSTTFKNMTVIMQALIYYNVWGNCAIGTQTKGTTTFFNITLETLFTYVNNYNTLDSGSLMTAKSDSNIKIENVTAIYKMILHNRKAGRGDGLIGTLWNIDSNNKLLFTLSNVFLNDSFSIQNDD